MSSSFRTRTKFAGPEFTGLQHDYGLQVRALRTRRAMTELYYSEKLVPQPQEAVAFGFFTLNEAPIKSSTKSISEPAM